ncbi:MAG: hypothetical protein R6U98_09765 [Pirellulaceae bacterium]
MESCPTQAVLPLVGLAAEKVIRDRYSVSSRFVLFSAEEVLSDVAREMEVANEVRHLGKDGSDRLEDAFAHVVDQRKRNAIGLFDASKERHDVSLIFSGQLDVTQNDFRKRVDRTRQQWIARFARGVQVTDVSAADLHVLGDVFPVKLSGVPLKLRGLRHNSNIREGWQDSPGISPVSSL